MVKETEIQHFEALGFHRNEALIYLEYLGDDAFTPSEAAKQCGLTRTLVYRALEKLKQKEICKEVSNNPKRFLIADPRLTLSDYIRKEEQKVENARLFLPELVSRFSSKQQKLGVDSQVVTINDMAQLANLYFELMMEAEIEVLAFMKPPYHGGNKRAEQDMEAQKLTSQQKKIITKGLYELEEGYFPFPDTIEDSIKYSGEEARMAESLPIKAMIFDCKKVMMLLPDDRPGHEDEETGLLVNNAAFAKMQKEVFQLYWNRSKEYFQWKEENRKQFLS